MPYKFSLSRAHKYVTRIHEKTDQINEQLTSLMMPIVVNVVGDESRATALRVKINDRLELIEKLAAGSTAIRLAIAEKNSAIGMHVHLANRAALSRQIQSLEAVLRHGQHASNSALDADQVPAYIARTSHLQTLPVVKVKVFNQDVQETLEEKIAKLKREELRLGDEINDLNSHQITVDLDAHIAEIIGLIE